MVVPLGRPLISKVIEVAAGKSVFAGLGTGSEHAGITSAVILVADKVSFSADSTVVGFGICLVSTNFEVVPVRKLVFVCSGMEVELTGGTPAVLSEAVEMMPLLTDSTIVVWSVHAIQNH